MKTFRFALILGAGAVMQLAPLSQPASAADMPGMKDEIPYQFVPVWTGFYFGGHAGAALGNTGVNDTFTYVGDPTWNGSLSNIGLIGGAQAGYNFQSGHFVFGPEADIGYLGLSASKIADNLQPPGNTCSATYNDVYTSGPKKGQHVQITYTGPICDVNAKYTGSSNLYGDLTGRLGYLMGRTLFYAKGGAAVLDADFKANYAGGNCLSIPGNANHSCGSGTGTPSTFNFDHSDVPVGWTAGAGVEYALNPRWSFKAEYQHFDFGSMSYSYSGCYAITQEGGSCPAANSQYNNHYTSTITGKTDVSLTADAVTLGFNYHLNNEAELK